MCTVVTDGTKRNKKFEKLCLKTQAQMKTYLASSLLGRKRKVEVGDGYVYSKGSIPVLLCAHMDTVHKNVPKKIIYKEGKIMSPQGIGGDDRCGIYMILEIIKSVDCHVIFFEDEETGGIGSDKFTQTETCKKLVGNIQYVIELDRMNAKDAVYYECDNTEFCDFIEKEYWEMNYGSFTDICNICPDLKCAGVNLSCGYYKQHTLNEYVVLEEMEKAIDETIKLIKRTTEKDSFEFVQAKHYWSKTWGQSYYSKLYGKSSYYDDYDDPYSYSPNTYNYNKYYDGYFVNEKTYEIGYMIDDEEYVAEEVGVSQAEAIGYFLMANADVCYDDIQYCVCLDE